MNQPACPSPDELKALDEGKLPEEKLTQIGQHVEGCEPCQKTLSGISASDDTLISAIRRPVPEEEFQKEPSYQRAESLIEAIGQDPTFTSAEAAKDSEKEKEEVKLGTLGQYQLITKLGEGGMGAVYKAMHTKLEKVVALKVLPADRMQNEDAVARFEREMKAVGKLSHANIVGAHDAGEVDDQHYLVMELVDGYDLSTLLRRHGPLGVADACELIRQAAVGLEHAHKRGMVHRDIKPSNLMLARNEDGDPLVKILDMGLALLDQQHAPGEGLTSSGQMMGTLEYMAPEQGMDSHTVDIRADIYSLGGSLYKLLCGETPFPASRYDTPVKMMMALATESAPSIAEKCILPMELVDLIDRMLQREPERRPATPQEVADALAPHCGNANLAALLEEQNTEDTKSTEPSAPTNTFNQHSSGSHDTDPTTQHSQPIEIDESPEEISLESVDSVELLSPDADVQPTPTPTKVPTAGPRPAGARDTKEPSTPSIPVIDTKSPTKKPKLNAKPKRAIPRWVPIAIAAGLGGILLFAAIILLIPGKHGTLQVTINDPSVEVLVKGTDIILKKADKEKVTLTPGEKTLIVRRGDFKFETNQLILKRGGTVTVEIELLAGTVQAVHNGDVIGAATLPAASPSSSYALQFGHANNSVEIPTLDYDSSFPLTIEGFVTVSIDSARQMRALNVGPLSLKVDYDGQWVSMVRISMDQKAEWKVAKGFAPKTSVRTHIAGIFTGKQLLLFLDGKLQQVVQVTEPLDLNWARNPTIGGDGRGRFEPFNGRISEVRISNVARYDKDFIPSTHHEPDEHTLALYHFDEGSGDVLHDSSGNGHHGKIVGAEWVRVDRSINTPTEPIAGSLESIELQRTWVAGARGIGQPTLSPDGRLLVTSNYQHLQLWDINSAKQVNSLAFDDQLHSAAFSPDGRVLACGAADQLVTLLDVQSGKKLETLKGHGTNVTAVAFSPNGKTLASAGHYHHPRVILWDVEKRELKKEFGGVSDGKELAFTPDSRFLVVAEPVRYAVVDLEAYKLRGEFRPSSKAACRFSLFRDGKQIIATSDDRTKMQLYSVPELKPGRAFGSHEAAISTVGLSPDETMVVSGDVSGRIKVWDLASGRLLHELHQHETRIRAILFTPDGRTLVTNERNGRVNVWSLKYSAGPSAQYALEFDGKSSHVAIPSLKYGGTHPLTIEEVVTPRAAPSDPSDRFIIKWSDIGLMVRQSDVAAERKWQASIKTRHPTSNVDEWSDLSSQLPWQDGETAHIALVYSGTQLRLFVDGKLEAIKECPKGVAPILRDSLLLGAATHDDGRSQEGFLPGLIDEVHISRVARYEKDFTPSRRFTPDRHTLALYHFDEGSGDVLHDSSGNGHHGKIVGAKWVTVDGAQSDDPPLAVAQAGNDYDHLATGIWIDVFKVDPPEPDSGNVIFRDGVLELNNHQFELSRIRGRNMIVRAQVKKISGQNLHLQLRSSDHEDDDMESYTAWMNGPQHIGLHHTVGSRGELLGDSRISPEGIVRKNGYVEIAYAAVGDRLLLYVNGKQRLERAGRTQGERILALAASHGRSMFKDVQVMLLDDVSAASTKSPPLAKAPFLVDEAKKHQQAWADYLGLPVEKEIALPGGEKMKFMLIPPGDFTMGSTEELIKHDLKAVPSDSGSWQLKYLPNEGPQHKVQITKAFYFATTEVTQAQWQAVMGSNPSQFKDDPRLPVEMVNWILAKQFLAKLNEQTPTDPMRFALPTEAQWEFACRAGTTTPWSSGDLAEDLSKFGWIMPKSNNRSHPVASLEPNPFGLYDMHGNVYEWCSDWYAEGYYAKSPFVDPTGAESGTNRVRRGGGWSYPPDRARSARRSAAPQTKVQG